LAGQAKPDPGLVQVHPRVISGSDGEARRVLATSTGMRSVVVVLYVAPYCFAGTRVCMVPIVDLSLMVPTNLLFHLNSSILSVLRV